MNVICQKSMNKCKEYEIELSGLSGQIKSFSQIDLTNKSDCIKTSLLSIVERVQSIKQSVNLDIDHLNNMSCIGVTLSTQRTFNIVSSSLDTGATFSGILMELLGDYNTHKYSIVLITVGQFFSKLNDYVSASLRSIQEKDIEFSKVKTLCNELEQSSDELYSIFMEYHDTKDEFDGMMSLSDHIEIYENKLTDRWKRAAERVLELNKSHYLNIESNDTPL